jgi:hypothetical protein
VSINSFLAQGFDLNGGSASVQSAATEQRAGLAKLIPRDRDQRGPTVCTVQVSAEVATQDISVDAVLPRAWVEFQWGTGRAAHRARVDAIPGQSFSLACMSLQAEAVVEGLWQQGVENPVEVNFTLSIGYFNHRAAPMWGGPFESLLAGATGVIRDVPPFATGVVLAQDLPATAANTVVLELSPNPVFALRQRISQPNRVPLVVQPLASGMRFYRVTNGAGGAAIIQPRFEIAL